MTSEQAQSAVALSAFVVAVVFAYRKLAGGKTAPSTSHFVIGFGFTYITLSLVAQAAPELGGMGAILVATGDVLVNGQGLVNDLQGTLQSTAPAAAAAGVSGRPSSPAIQAPQYTYRAGAQAGSTH
jgi:hypothetical protein